MAAFAGQVTRQTNVVVNYAKYGADWPADGSIVDNECGGVNQSPIDLKLDFDQVPYDGDMQKHYEDMESGKITWSPFKYSTYVDLPGYTDFAKARPNTKLHPNFFQSKYAKSTFNVQQDFEAVRFEFHSRSEHTIEGRQYDFEMQTVHELDDKENGFSSAITGIMFDEYHYDQSVTPEQVDIIDNFFDSLMMDKLKPAETAPINEVALSYVPYGQLMNMANTEKRWVYKGSLTTPPCTESIYWNVVTKVYPIKPKHLQQFQKLIVAEIQGNNVNTILQGGNYREIQPLNQQNPKLMESPVVEERAVSADNAALRIVFTVLLLIIIIEMGIAYNIWTKKWEAAEKKKAVEMHELEK